MNALLRRALGAPRAIYGAGLGHRFLELTHRGRRTGMVHRTVLEVLEWRPAEHEAIVMSGFGPRAQWLQNVEAGGAAEIRVARERWTPQARRLSSEEAVAVLAGYERGNRLIAPLIRAILSRLSGVRHDGSEQARAQIVQALPLVAFRPHPSGRSGARTSGASRRRGSRRRH